MGVPFFESPIFKKYYEFRDIFALPQKDTIPEVVDNYRAIGVTLQYRPILSISLHTGHIMVNYVLMVLHICTKFVFMFNLGSSTRRKLYICYNQVACRPHSNSSCMDPLVKVLVPPPPQFPQMT